MSKERTGYVLIEDVDTDYPEFVAYRHPKFDELWFLHGAEKGDTLHFTSGDVDGLIKTLKSIRKLYKEEAE